MLLAFKLKLASRLRGRPRRSARGGAAALRERASRRSQRRGSPALVELQPGTVSYRVAGDFTRAGKPAEAPLRDGPHRAPARDHEAPGQQPPTISAASTRAPAARCPRRRDRGRPPAVQVSWHDADAYAAWLSRKTGDTYRLPTDEEWAYAAGSRYQGRRPAGRRQRSLEALARALRARGRACRSRRSTTSRSRSALSAPTRTVLPMSPAMSGNGPAPASCAPRSMTPARQSEARRELRRPRRRRAAPRLCHRFHPRRARRRMRGRRAAEQSRLPPGARAQTLAESAFIRAPQGTVDRAVLTQTRHAAARFGILLNLRMESL